MSKEELLKYLIAEIDLIMHDKDYRFENANGTWYSRESCRDLTNEEVFEELRTELRQFADIEAKLANKDKELKELKLDLGMFKSVNEFINSYGIEKAREVLLQTEKTKNQDKISFALEQLEKVKEKLNDYDIQDILSSSSDPYGEFDENCVTTDKINQIIDNQIKSLKGEEK